MSDDLRDLFKKELDQIPLRPMEAWVPGAVPRSATPGLAWRTPIAIGGAALLLVAAIIGGGQLASFRERAAATPGVVAGRALYLSPSFNGSGWIQIDPDNLQDLSSKPLLDIAPSPANSSATLVSDDGSTIVVSDYSQGGVKQSVYDGRTGRLRGYFAPAVPMALDSLSADGQFALGRAGDNRTPMTAEKVVVSLADGHLVRSVPPTGEIGVIERRLVAPDLSAIYYVVTPSGTLDVAIPQSRPYALVIQSTTTGAVADPISLPGIAAATVVSGPAGAGTVLERRPAVAISPDGTKVAALSGGRALVIVDTRTRAVTVLTVQRKSSLFDLFRPLVAQAKVPSDEERVAAAFTPDGQSLISFTTLTHYEEGLRGPTLTTRGIERIEVGTGLITAEAFAPEGIYGLKISPDSRSVYLIVRAKEPPTELYLLRRLDAQTLELKAERGLPDYAELELLAAPDPQAARIRGPLPSAPQRSVPGAALRAIFDSTPDYPGYPWVRDGRPVKPEEVGTIAGPAHCGWRSATFLTIGWPVGTVSTSSAESRQYIRDPRGVIPNRPRGRLDLNVSVPSDARATGYTYGAVQIYVSPSEDDAIYLVGPTGAERWPRSVPISLCQ